jgi:hypothetical protein
LTARRFRRAGFGTGRGLLDLARQYRAESRRVRECVFAALLTFGFLRLLAALRRLPPNPAAICFLLNFRLTAIFCPLRAGF